MQHPGLPYALYRAEQVRALDKAAIEGFGIPGYELMSTAGQAAFDVLQQHWPKARHMVVVNGLGNNGGDGFIVARLGLKARMKVVVLQLGDDSKIKGDAAKARESYLAAGGRIEPFDPQQGLPRETHVVVDGLLGTGLEREVKGDWLLAIEAMNRARCGVLALDIPSGLHSDTGRVMGAAVNARHTVTFIGMKQGLFTGEGPACCGEIHFSDLDVPKKIYATQILSCQRLTFVKAAQDRPQRSGSDHKGRCGHVLVMGGAPGYSGAARMSAEAAVRSGAGLVSLATHPDHAALIAQARPEVMSHGVMNVGDLTDLMQRASVLAIGPGLGRDAWGDTLWQAALDSDLPKVVDADALNRLAEQPLKRDDWILTPHPGEAARLLQCSTTEIQNDRIAAAKALQQQYGGVVVLKGAGTVVDFGDRVPGICSDGNAGMATGGMGDVLTGVIAALWAQGLDAGMAARLGVCIHGTAADRAVAEDGMIGLMATDLMPWLRRLMNEKVEL